MTVQKVLIKCNNLELRKEINNFLNQTATRFGLEHTRLVTVGGINRYIQAEVPSTNWLMVELQWKFNYVEFSPCSLDKDLRNDKSFDNNQQITVKI